MKVCCKFFIAFFFFLISFSSVLWGQNVKDSLLFFPMLKFSYALQIPAGDLADRFGYNSNAGLNFSIKTKKNLVFGANGSFIFGDQIKENGILDSLKTSSGFIINQNGNPSVVRLFERGFVISLHIGKLFPVFSPNKNSGIIATIGPSFLLHKIKMDDIGRQSPQLVDPYPKGYDRLSVGLGVHEFIGYLYLSNKRMLNFFGGFEFVQAFTKSQRSYDYDLMRTDTENRFDLLNGIRVGWVLPLYKKTPQEFYYH